MALHFTKERTGNYKDSWVRVFITGAYNSKKT